MVLKCMHCPQHKISALDVDDDDDDDDDDDVNFFYSEAWHSLTVILLTVTVNSLPSLSHYAPVIRLRRMALYKCVLIG